MPPARRALFDTSLSEVWERFHQAHAREYGHSFRENPIEIVNIRATGIGAMPKIQRSKAPAGGDLAAARIRNGACVFRVGAELKTFDTTFYRRRLLPGDERFAGPAFVLQKDSTTVIPPGWTAIVDSAGNLLLSTPGDA
jgi:N-methylhydantoinase A